MLTNMLVLCLALPTTYTKPIKIDLAEMYTIIQSQEELKNIQNAVCDIRLIDHCSTEWMCVEPYESKLAITRPDTQYFIANTQTGTMAYTVKR